MFIERNSFVEGKKTHVNVMSWFGAVPFAIRTFNSVPASASDSKVDEKMMN